MKPFDLELAKAGHSVQTRDGRPARIVCYDAINLYCPIVALITHSDGQELPLSYCNDGKLNPGGENPLDLLLAPIKKEGWVNLYRLDEKTVVPSDSVYSTYEEAFKLSKTCTDSSKYVATTKIEWEE